MSALGSSTGTFMGMSGMLFILGKWVGVGVVGAIGLLGGMLLWFQGVLTGQSKGLAEAVDQTGVTV